MPPIQIMSVEYLTEALLHRQRIQQVLLVETD
jgi:hypothetical protein